MLHFIAVLPVGDAALCTAEEKSCRLSSPPIALTVAWMCFWVRLQENAKKSLFTCPGLVSVEKEEWGGGVEVGRGGRGVRSEERWSECWPTSVGGPWDSADWSFREDALSRCAVKQLHRQLFPGCVYECLIVCVCVCCCSSILVRTNLSGPFRPWEWQHFWLVLTSFKVWLGVLVKVPLQCVLLFVTLRVCLSFTVQDDECESDTRRLFSLSYEHGLKSDLRSAQRNFPPSADKCENTLCTHITLLSESQTSRWSYSKLNTLSSGGGL